MTGLNGEKEQTTQGTRTAGDIVIWMYGDSRTPFESVVADFQSASPSAAGKNIIVESFSDYETYTDALTSAFLQGTGPDIFTLNNNDTSLFE
ncbi:MAG: hypothetical protein H6767_03095 [Candidatus Peribacteria bacterium]|nr:MAG: hypothetical protein H6767_03095 [Candidatus Peribacteria bacterium]